MSETGWFYAQDGKPVGPMDRDALIKALQQIGGPEALVYGPGLQTWTSARHVGALMEGLSGQADYRHEGFVTYKGLDYFVSNQVKKLTLGLQTPVTTVPIGLADFALAQVVQSAN